MRQEKFEWIVDALVGIVVLAIAAMIAALYIAATPDQLSGEADITAEMEAGK